MADVECTISGLDELEKQLNELIPRKAKLAMRRALGNSAAMLKLFIEGADPVKTGFLKGHEVLITRTAGDGILVAKVGPQANAGYFENIVVRQSATSALSAIRYKKTAKVELHGSEHFPSVYGSIYEFGSKHQPARPVMGPALDNNKDLLLNIFIGSLKQELESTSDTGGGGSSGGAGRERDPVTGRFI